MFIYIYINLYPTASHPATVPIRRTVVTLVAGLSVCRSVCLLLLVCLWVRIRRTVVTLVAGRSVCVSAFVCLPLGQIFGIFVADLGFRGVPWGHIKGTWTLKMITLVPHLAGGGPRARFLVNLGCILGAILNTILHTDGHL